MLRWRQFFLAAAGLFGFSGGSEWDTSHYRMKVVVRGVRSPFFLRQRTSGVAAVTPVCANRRHRACGKLWLNGHTPMESPGPIPASHGSALFAGGVWLGGTGWGCKCIPSIVPGMPRVGASLLKKILFLTLPRSRALVSGTSFDCLSSFSGLRRLRPVPNPPRFDIRRRCNAIERHRSSPRRSSPAVVSHP